MPTTRRQFLALVGTLAAATGLPREVVAQTLTGGAAGAAQAAALTTMAERLGPGAAGAGGWRPVVAIGGDRHVVRDDLAAPQPGRQGRRRTLLHFAHLTDQHIVDVQSPARVEFVDRFAGGACASFSPVGGAFRPQEAASTRITDAMIRRLRRIAVSPITGAPLTAAVCTGDNTDNQQANELAMFLTVMDGGRVTPNSGHPTRYEGVQASGNVDYWHPDPAVPDRYKTELGFPARPGFLEAALAPFDAVGIGVPWYSCYGNHDGLVQGNNPPMPPIPTIAAGPVKVVGAPPGTDPCSAGLPIGGGPGAAVMTVTADPNRRFLTRREWIEGHVAAKGLPKGHGFGPTNVAEATAYHAHDVGALRWIVLDTVNPGGFAEGSIGDRQLKWLDAELTAADERRRPAILFSHHGLRSMSNPFMEPDPTQDPALSDLPRHLAADVQAVLDRHPSVIAWVNGHTHDNVIEVRGRFWDIGTAAHIDWPAQSRLIEVVDNRDGTLSIFTTLVDHESDGPDGGDIAGFARQLGGNDRQHGFAKGVGDEGDRNTELLLPHPFAAAAAPGGGPAPAPGTSTPRGSGPTPAPGGQLPATGLPSNLTVGGALALAGSMGLLELRRRAQS